MPNFPISDFSEAVARLLSNLMPPKTYRYLFACLPGLFFEVCILIANPALIYSLDAKLQGFITLGHSTKVLIALFLAFVIGAAFTLFVTLIRQLLHVLFKLLSLFWRHVCGWPLIPIVSRMVKSTIWQKRRWVHSLYQYAYDKHYALPDNFLDPERCWGRIARSLLKNYGVDPDLTQGEWNALYFALAPLTLEDQPISPFMLTSEAIGWSALASIHFAPTLRSTYFLGFTALMVITGLLHDWYFVKARNNPRFQGILKIRSLLKEFQSPAASRPEKPPAD